MTKEVMQQALEALRMPCEFWNKTQFIKVTEAIKALEEALKQEQNEIERLTVALKKANEQAEHFEREWYLRGDELEKSKQEQGETVAWNVIDPSGNIVATEKDAIRGWARVEGYKPTVEGLLGFHEQGWRVLPAQQEQDEPVAMRYDFDGYGYKYIDSGSGSDWQTREKGAEPLYEQTKEWVGLTDEDIEDCYIEELYLFAVALEARLKEKNS